MRLKQKITHIDKEAGEYMGTKKLLELMPCLMNTILKYLC